jgi:hypothetical protein
MEYPKHSSEGLGNPGHLVMPEFHPKNNSKKNLLFDFC